MRGVAVGFLDEVFRRPALAEVSHEIVRLLQILAPVEAQDFSVVELPKNIKSSQKRHNREPRNAFAVMRITSPRVKRR
jgi:hypothetical protein